MWLLMSRGDELKYPRDNFIIIAFTFCISRLKIANSRKRGPVHAQPWTPSNCYSELSPVLKAAACDHPGDITHTEISDFRQLGPLSFLISSSSAWVTPVYVAIGTKVAVSGHRPGGNEQMVTNEIFVFRSVLDRSYIQAICRSWRGDKNLAKS